MMDQLCFLGINLSNLVGVSDLKTNLCQAKLINFQYHVTNMTNKMMVYYQLVLENKGCHNNMVLKLYAALLSGKNGTFSSLIQRKKGNWETRSDESHKILVHVSTAKYKNMIM